MGTVQITSFRNLQERLSIWGTNRCPEVAGHCYAVPGERSLLKVHFLWQSLLLHRFLLGAAAASTQHVQHSSFSFAIPYFFALNQGLLEAFASLFMLPKIKIYFAQIT